MENISKIPSDVLDFLIKKYAVGRPYPKIAYMDFNEFDNPEFDIAGAAYLPDKNLIVLNLRDIAESIPEEDKFRTIVFTVLHEIQHFNQSILWQQDKNYRIKLSKGKIPANFEKHIMNLKKIDTLIDYWSDHYHYDDRPHEIDAMEFASKHTYEAMNLILKREKSLKNNSKVDKVTT